MLCFVLFLQILKPILMLGHEPVIHKVTRSNPWSLLYNLG